MSLKIPRLLNKAIHSFSNENEIMYMYDSIH